MINISMESEKITHPLEKFFNIEEGTTDITKSEINSEIIQYELYDEKDEEIESGFQEIYDKALNAYNQLQNEMLDVEAKYMPRMSEVSNQHLNTALNAAQAKLKLKELKEKINKSKSEAPRSQTNILQINTVDLIKKLKAEAAAIVVEANEIPSNNNTNSESNKK